MFQLMKNYSKKGLVRATLLPIHRQPIRCFGVESMEPKKVVSGPIKSEDINKVDPKRPLPESLRLPSQLQKKLDEYRKKRNFNAKTWVAKKTKMFNDYMRKAKLTAALVSVSGGVDSAVTLGLIALAKKEKDTPLKRILALSQPIHSSKWAYDRAKEVAEKFDVPFACVDQSDIHDRYVKLIDHAIGIKGEKFATGQLRSYLRTPTNYYVAQLLSQSGTPCVVMGTGNQDEDGYLAYFCKAGDGVVDVSLLADLHKWEVFAVGKEIGVPKSTLDAAPSADLWEGQTDEEELGFGYDFIELFTGSYLPLDEEGQSAWRQSLPKDELETFQKWEKAAVIVHNRNKHKLHFPHCLNVMQD